MWDSETNGGPRKEAHEGMIEIYIALVLVIIIYGNIYVMCLYVFLHVLFLNVGIMAHYWNDGYTIEIVAILLKRWLTIGIVAILLEW